MTELGTSRLWLRQWRERDLEPFAALNADPRVMEFMPARLSPAESDALARRSQTEIAAQGFGFWAVELRENGRFIGFVGLRAATFEAHFTPCVEIGWRLARASWGQGLATEAARECLRFAFQRLALPEVVAFTVPLNRRSCAVMERLGMRRAVSDDFEHPAPASGPSATAPCVVPPRARRLERGARVRHNGMSGGGPAPGGDRDA